MSSFFKRLFGDGGQTPPASAAPDPNAELIAGARAHAASFDRRREPLKWAEAMQVLGHNLSVAAGNDTARHAEAEAVLADAHAVAGPSSHPLFRASILKLLGETRYRHGELLTGDPRGHKLADAANTLADALALVEPHDNRTLWMEAASFRGAALHELGRLKSGPEGLAWMDQAAACFADIARHGAEDGVHPVGLYNRYAVLEQRGHRTEGGGRAAIYREARAALAAATTHEMFAGRPDLAVKLAELDALIEASD